MKGDKCHDGHRVTSTRMERRFRILTVGDGDLTCSLALARAYSYGNNTTLDLVASTLLSSKQELIKTYSNAANVLRELEERNVTVLYSVNATKLNDTLYNSIKHMNDDDNKKWDAIMFHHPHLGDGSLQVQNEQAHANRHYVLLAHYLYSAKLCLRDDGGVVHLCLCGRQAQTWRVQQAAQRQGLVLQQTVSTTVPIHLWLPLKVEAAPVLPHYPAPRRYRNGKLGSKHFLGRFGYRHRRTHGNDHHHQAGHVNVAGSLHYVFEIDQTWNRECTVEQTSETECTVCGMTFESAQELQQHCQTPALPDPVDGECHGSTKSLGSTRPLGKSVSAATSENDSATSSIDNAKPTNGPRNNEIATNDNGLCSFLVKQEHDAKRLRWLLRQQVLGDNGNGLSKQKTERMIQAGRVALNGTIIVDSARLVHTNDQITLFQESTTANDCFSKATRTPLEVHYQSTNLVVVFKPVGMRTIGSFSSETLEMTVSAQMKEPLKAISKMDTGCSGLCVLQQRDAHTDDVHISQVFTALVHGHVPESWNGLVLALPNKGRRQWRKDGEKREGDDEHLDDTRTNKDLVEISVLETTDPLDGVSAPLSTVTMTTFSNTSGLCNAICFLLRKHGHPVVNDRLCRREYLTLPRSIRNLIKNRLCIGCYEVHIWKEKDEESKNITVDLPDRLHATYWQSHHVKQNV